MYDVIVVGARCSGASTAMLLAQKGYRVLLLDRASFPSDTLSTHIVHIKDGSVLQKWGLYETVMQTNCPPVRRIQFLLAGQLIRGQFPPLNGVDAVLCPRRTVLDKVLVDAAVAAGAELREDFLVEELLVEDGCVIGVRGRSLRGGEHPAAGYPLEEKASLVIGADGKHSQVARMVQAAEYQVKAIQTCAYYTYWDGLELDHGEMYALQQTSVGIWPTNDGLAMIYTPYPIGEFPLVRKDIEGHFWRTIGMVPGLTERLRAGRQAERFYGTADLPAFYRRSYGPGWALAGDAGMTLDPITGQGISNAFHDAERTAEAIHATFSGKAAFDQAMSTAEQARSADTLPLYEFTSQLASFAPIAVEQRALFAVLARKPEAANQFFGALTGSIPFTSFFTPANMLRILGPGGIARSVFGKIAGSRKTAPI